MLAKLAMRNVRKSLRDYVIYFVTLVLGVAMFYAFNSIESQEVLFDAEATARVDVFEDIQGLMGMFSVVVACVLGFLVLYSNRFLIRRRKREFGTYEILGLSAGQVARIMLCETVVVGLGALVVGLLIGILISQGLSFVTGLLFGATIKNYQFVFSESACMSTIICFAVIFVLMALFNTVTVNHYKLIDLLQAGTKSEKSVARNPWACLVVFVFALGILAFAYYELAESEMVMLDDPRFIGATVGMLVGSFLFFWSVAGFASLLITHARSFYLKGVRPFTVRQITSRINTAFVSLWAVCVLLFFSITVFSSGMGLVNVFVGEVEAANPFDASIRSDVFWKELADRARPPYTELGQRAAAFQADDPERYALGVEHDWDIAACLEDANPELWNETVAESAQINLYDVFGVTYAQLAEQLDPAVRDQIMDSPALTDAVGANCLAVASVSQMNAIRHLTGADPLTLEDDQFMLANNAALTMEFAEALAEAGASADIYGTQLTCAPQICDTQLEDTSMLSTAMLLIVPDAVIDDMVGQNALPHWEYTGIMYADNGKTEHENFLNLQRVIAAVQPLEPDAIETMAGEEDEPNYALYTWPVTMVISGVEMMQQSSGLRMIITYLALYIGFVFLICTAAILAIQQLTNVVDSQGRYRMLWRLGVGEGKLNHSLLTQIMIYFLTPLALALCHSAWALRIMNEQLFAAFGGDVITSVGICAVLVLVIYGGYLMITYLAAKSVLRPTMRLG